MPENVEDEQKLIQNVNMFQQNIMQRGFEQQVEKEVNRHMEGILSRIQELEDDEQASTEPVKAVLAALKIVGVIKWDLPKFIQAAREVGKIISVPEKSVDIVKELMTDELEEKIRESTDKSIWAAESFEEIEAVLDDIESQSNDPNVYELSEAEENFVKSVEYELNALKVHETWLKMDKQTCTEDFAETPFVWNCKGITKSAVKLLITATIAGFEGDERDEAFLARARAESSQLNRTGAQRTIKLINDCTDRRTTLSLKKLLQAVIPDDMKLKNVVEFEKVTRAVNAMIQNVTKAWGIVLAFCKKCGEIHSDKVECMSLGERCYTCQSKTHKISVCTGK